MVGGNPSTAIRKIPRIPSLSPILPPMRTCDPARGQQILDCAARLFDKRHYHEVRMEDVAAHAGVAKGTLYRYFQDKEDLYLALLLSALERLRSEMASAL